MKAVVTKSDNSGPELVERPIPNPGHGEVLLKIAAAGINGADLSQAKGRYPVPAGATDILGLEASGEITALGGGVTQWKVGDKVCALLVGGGYAEYVAVPAVQCLPVPKGLSVVEAAALPECVITVWLNVFDLGGLKPGDRLLVHGGSSGIGTTAIQIASALGSEVVITAGNAAKCQRCTALGASLAIDYNSQDYVEAIEGAFGKRSIDVSLNMVGGDYVRRDIRLVMHAAGKGSKIEFDYTALNEKDGRMTGSRLRPRPIQEKGRLTAAVRKAVWPLIESGKFKPIIEKTYPLSEIDAAHKHMAGSHIGKILLTL